MTSSDFWNNNFSAGFWGRNGQKMSQNSTVVPSVRSLPRYLRIACMDFLEIFRKVQSYANLERDIFGFLKEYFFGRILWKNGQKISQKLNCPSVLPSVCPFVRSLPRYFRIAWMDFLEIFRKVQSYANVERHLWIWGKVGKKWAKNSQKLDLIFFEITVHPYHVSCRGDP